MESIHTQPDGMESGGVLQWIEKVNLYMNYLQFDLEALLNWRH